MFHLKAPRGEEGAGKEMNSGTGEERARGSERDYEDRLDIYVNVGYITEGKKVTPQSSRRWT